MAYWTDEDGLNHIDYKGHMCIHEMLSRQGPEFYEDSQTWLEEMLPSVDVVHIEISFFNLIFLPAHILALQQEYPNVSKIIVTRSPNNWERPEYAVETILNNNKHQLSKEIDSFGFIRELNETRDNIEIEESLLNMQPIQITNYHANLIYERMKTIFWNKPDMPGHMNTGKFSDFGTTYWFWYMPLHKSNAMYKWQDFKNMIYSNAVKV
jgi:hypothetical protein